MAFVSGGPIGGEEGWREEERGNGGAWEGNGGGGEERGAL